MAIDRRSLLTAGGLGLVRAAGAQPAPAPIQDRLCLFTDHLDDYGYPYEEIAGMLKQLGIAGPDLTVRPGGLVTPERVAEELPKAAAAFRAKGLSIPMISTGLTSADAQARATLATAGKLGVGYFKLGYYDYPDAADWRKRLAAVGTSLRPLVQLARECGVQSGFHNHSGPSVGGAIWDSWELLREMDPKWIGFYFDP